MESSKPNSVSESPSLHDLDQTKALSEQLLQNLDLKEDCDPQNLVLKKLDDGVDVDVDGEGEKTDKLHTYPFRPDAGDCSYYMKTGTCRFGSKCKFNHPVTRPNSQVPMEKVTEERSRSGWTECKYYSSTGECNYGKDCRHRHTKNKTLNSLGLPIRLGEKECTFYLRTRSCKYGENCKFNHPDPSSAGGNDTSGYGNGASARPSTTSSRTLKGTPHFAPMMQWNRDQAMNQSPEFPERPGQPECSYYSKTGGCKFKSNCKYHHPKARSPAVHLSDTGLPLRSDQSICTHYSLYGICKFGPLCKFDHPLHYASAMAGFDAETHQFV